ncbi:PEP-CTERM sorting domain-containing protein [Massilia sp. P8910]|uniref:PEP-CTERM sorting domain-containing protein n=1 Tax=Massilia antarctica TaxID=2765360 RepID=UPI001E415CE2|nr:PEP-CTERM sorting domain-containing protein [Massilia antarctica]MCE3607221.1 PEP-CTERM sorting domain-containing protein [Massilia antarctica]
MSIHPYRFASGTVALAALLAFAPLHASAAAHLDTTAFSFDSASPGRADTLLADGGGATTISLLGAHDMIKYDAADPSWNGPYDHLYQGVFQLNVHAGYKITGYSLMGTFSGEHYVGQFPTGSDLNIMPMNWGAAYAGAGVAIRADLPTTGGAVAPLSHQQHNLKGTDAFTLDSGPLDHAGPMNLYVEGFAFAEATAAEWWYLDYGFMGKDYSRARIELSGPLLLTVYTQAVPEPHTYAMTLAGLALIGGTLRRRRRLARSGAQADFSLKG